MQAAALPRQKYQVILPLDVYKRQVHDELINMRKEKGRNIAEQFEEWDNAMDNIYFDEETGQLMQSVTVPGGDVIQIPYEKEEE